MNSDDANNSIIEIDGFIEELCEYGDKIENLTEAQKNFYFNQKLEIEVNNGGFKQFFVNSSGAFSHETVTSLLAIGANKTAEILRQAIEKFPDKTVPKNRNERIDLLLRIEASAIAAWEELDQMFFAYEENLNFLNLQYIKQNRLHF